MESRLSNREVAKLASRRPPTAHDHGVGHSWAIHDDKRAPKQCIASRGKGDEASGGGEGNAHL